MFSPIYLKKIRPLIWLIALSLLLYGLGRLYYKVTDGFRMANITSDFSYDPRKETKPLTQEERNLVQQILKQKFSYLGKGCQSYVFLSQDGNYVLKFFKYQRFRTTPWINFFSFIPSIDRYRERKLEKKREKLDGFMISWKIAYDELKKESALVFVHLNKSHDLNQTLTFTDKMGFEHQVDLDQMEFLIQHKVSMLEATLIELMDAGKEEEAKLLIDHLIALIMSEYKRGLADNDHALLQNTGVYQGKPTHVDVGQFLYYPEITQPKIYKQELFSKTYHFHKWLKKDYPPLADHLEKLLVSIIGEEFYTLKPIFKPHD